MEAQAVLTQNESNRCVICDRLQRNVPYVCFDIINDTAKKEIVSLLSRIGGKAHLKWTKHTSHLTTNSLRLSPEVGLNPVSRQALCSSSFCLSL